MFVYLAYKGISSCIRNAHDRVFLVAFVSYLIIGVGSFFFHSTLKCRLCHAYDIKGLTFSRPHATGRRTLHDLHYMHYVLRDILPWPIHTQRDTTLPLHRRPRYLHYGLLSLPPRPSIPPKHVCAPYLHRRP